jgi:PPK2 family polyphosphate:nucleotide phosphotransferase
VRWLVPPGEPFRLDDVDPDDTPGAPGDDDATDHARDALREQLIDFQQRLYAESQRSLLLVIQAMDAGGKDGTIKKVFAGVNPQGCRVRAFKEPSEEELAHDFLWRVHPHAPRKGEIAIFNRSHYEAVLVERVLDLTPETVWRRRYATINAFEQGLVDEGTHIVKVMLHISRDEQAKRFASRREDPTKRWKYSEGDLTMTKHWAAFMEAYSDAITETSTPAAPWYVIPANHKWYRNWAVLTILTDTLTSMNPQ